MAFSRADVDLPADILALIIDALEGEVSSLSRMRRNCKI